ncbi:Anamorsin-like protein [Trichoplax sp. H2]|nr:Anamorsin-like protein [Trichoplax sp. H2]|eukprot:RDD43090.1 Anamorsin-like protein [Trichoplax sp. H2]
MESVSHLVSNGQSVLLVWSQGGQLDTLANFTSSLRERVGTNGTVAVENINRLSQSSYGSSTFDVALSNVVSSYCCKHTSEQLAQILKMLKPDCKCLLRDTSPSDQIRSELILAGFTDISIVAEDNATVKVNARKPNFEIGSSAALPFANKISLGGNSKMETAKMWTLSSQDFVDDDIDIIDENTLIEEDDFLKPDPSSLRSQECDSAKKKRKACKNCSCGLAEEIESEKKTNGNPVSSCGSCYLGDAFRCSSCPYLGMPAFKPGEKVALPSRLLQADV